MKQLKWIERQFNFGYGPEYLPLYLERLRSTAPRIEELTKGLTDEKASLMPGGKWSVKQHIGHLSDLETLHDGRLFDFLEGKKILRAADMENKATEAASHNKLSVTKLISDLRDTRENFIKHVSSFTDHQLQFRALHPRLQTEINVIDMLHFVAEHDLFHQVHISGII